MLRCKDSAGYDKKATEDLMNQSLVMEGRLCQSELSRVTKRSIGTLDKQTYAFSTGRCLDFAHFIQGIDRI